MDPTDSNTQLPPPLPTATPETADGPADDTVTPPVREEPVPSWPPHKTYAAWARNHPERTQSIEQLLRTGVYLVSNQQHVLSYEAASTFTTLLSHANQAILAPQEPISTTQQYPQPYGTPPPTTTDDDGPTQPRHAGTDSLLPRQKVNLLLILRDVQQLFELLCSRYCDPSSVRKAVFGFECVKTAVVARDQASRYRCLLQRALLTLRQKGIRRGQSAAGLTERRGVPSALVIPDVLAPGTQGPGAFGSWAEVLAGLLDAWDLFKPAVLAYLYLRSKWTWRRWLIGVLVETAIYVISERLRVTIPPSIADQEDIVAVPVAAVQQRLSGATSYFLKPPFFDTFIRPHAKSWLVEGWFARKVPLLGTILATSVNHSLEMQKSSYFYSSGN